MLNFYSLQTLGISLIVFFCAVLAGSNVYGLSNVKDVSLVGIDEKLNEAVNLDLSFTDHNGKAVTLGSYFDDKPVVINMMYLSCPRVCGFAIEGVSKAIEETKDFKTGTDYRVLSISFNPEEDHLLAKQRSKKYLNDLAERSRGSDAGWMFLTGDKDSIIELTKSMGYKFMKDGHEFAHPSALVVLTPEGKISRYLYGIQHNPRDYKLALIEASAGKIGKNSLSNKVLLFCYQFDPVGKKYALKALNIVKAGGMVTLFALSGFLAFFWIREKKTN